MRIGTLRLSRPQQLLFTDEENSDRNMKSGK